MLRPSAAPTAKRGQYSSYKTAELTDVTMARTSNNNIVLNLVNASYRLAGYTQTKDEETGYSFIEKRKNEVAPRQINVIIPSSDT